MRASGWRLAAGSSCSAGDRYYGCRPIKAGLRRVRRFIRSAASVPTLLFYASNRKSRWRLPGCPGRSAIAASLRLVDGRWVAEGRRARRKDASPREDVVPFRPQTCPFWPSGDGILSRTRRTIEYPARRSGSRATRGAGPDPQSTCGRRRRARRRRGAAPVDLLRPGGVLQLQRSAGNAAVARRLGGQRSRVAIQRSERSEELLTKLATPKVGEGQATGVQTELVDTLEQLINQKTWSSTSCRATSPLVAS